MVTRDKEGKIEFIIIIQIGAKKANDRLHKDARTSRPVSRSVIFLHMNKEEIKSRFDAVLSRLGMDTTAWQETISPFREKLELLFVTE